MKRIFFLFCIALSLHISAQQADTIYGVAAVNPMLYRVPDLYSPQHVAGFLAGTDQLMSGLVNSPDSGSVTTENVQIFNLNQNVTVTGAIFWCGAKNYVSGNPNSRVIFNLYRLDSIYMNVYEKPKPGPGTILSSVSVPLADIQVRTDNDPARNLISFSSSPVAGSFAVGYDISQMDHKDTIGFFTSFIGKPPVKDMSLIKFLDSPWRSFKDSLNGWDADIDLSIFPIVEGYNGNCLDFFPYLTATDANCGHKGSITTTTYGGLPPYTYDWSNGDTTRDISNLNPGRYQLTVYDQSGCYASAYADIVSDCYSIISGTVFSDTDGNCLYTGSEPTHSGRYVMATQNGNEYYSLTAYNGTYEIKVPGSGTYSVTVYKDYYNCTTTTPCNGDNLQLTITTPGDTLADNNFGYTNDPSYDLGIYPTWSNINPGFESDYWIHYYSEPDAYNAGTHQIIFTYDTALVYQRSDDPQPQHNAVNHTLTWSIDSFPSEAFFWDNALHVVFETAPTLSLDYVVQNKFDLTPTEGDCNLSDNHLALAQSVRGSFDPNEKEVSPANYLYEDDSLLTYTIHFQNTGTDSTHFIIVIDTLSTELNPATVHTIASSHPYSNFTVSGQGILKWEFNPIRLVDSITNPEGSKGFVMFTVEKRSNRSVGDVISNRASIYFDYNEPVMTNTVTDTIAVRTGIADIALGGQRSMELFPNPASSELFIHTRGFEPKTITVYDMSGKLITEISPQNNSLSKIAISTYSAGAYFVEAKNKDIVIRQRFIKTEE